MPRIARDSRYTLAMLALRMRLRVSRLPLMAATAFAVTTFALVLLCTNKTGDAYWDTLTYQWPYAAWLAGPPIGTYRIEAPVIARSKSPASRVRLARVVRRAGAIARRPAADL